MSKLACIAATLFVIPTPVLAQIVFVDVPTKVEPTKADSPKSDTDKIECRTQDTTGTRLGRHVVCLTREQWWLYEHEQKEWLARIQALSTIGSGG
jgi:hypothetical protein